MEENNESVHKVLVHNCVHSCHNQPCKSALYTGKDQISISLLPFINTCNECVQFWKLCTEIRLYLCLQHKWKHQDFRKSDH